MDIQQALARIVEGESLNRDEMQAVMHQVMSGDATEAQIGGLLIALRMKGETTDEIAGAAQVMRELATPVEVNDPHLVDLVGVFGTIFGLATSLGLGITPIAAGLANLGWMENTQTNQLILIAIITALGTASAVSGVGKGVRILSEINVWASIGLLILFVILAPTDLYNRYCRWPVCHQTAQLIVANNC